MTEPQAPDTEHEASSVLRLSVLGPVSASREGAAINLGGEKQRTVLALFVAGAGSPVSVDALIEGVWGEEAADRARRTVQTYVSTLRSLLGDCIVKAGNGWRLDLGDDQVDARVFERLYEAGRRELETDPETASALLREALGLWSGHPYSEVDAHGALAGETTRLVEVRVAAKAARIDADLAMGRDSDLVGELEALLVEYPYSERFRAQHMLALYRAGRQQESLRSYGEMRTVLLEELGVDPTPELQSLERRILEQDDSLGAPVPASIRKRAVLVADPGDPVEIGHLPTSERDDLLARISGTLRSALAGSDEPQTFSVGVTTYAIFDSARGAITAAERAASQADGARMRYAIDWGDIIVDDGGVSGPPVTRAAVMAASAHPGQVVLSGDTQRAIADAGDEIGLRFEALGTHDLRGVEDAVLIYQLLVGDDPESFPTLQVHRAPPPLPAQNVRSLPGYELRDSVGQGSVGLMHRAYQPVVGREVLIEVINRVDAADPDFIRSFEADAQRLSLIDHQNIASVIDHWRQPDGAFLVYRYPRGGLLSEANSQEPARILDQVGSALAFAHSLGLIHGSVRPDRIALDEGGNASLLGFPIAGIAPPTSISHPAYIAPELLTVGELTERTDVYSLGVLAQELLVGVLSFDAPVESSHPAIARALSPDPADRHASVVEFLTELNPVGDASPELRYTETRNPYKGLAAFHESDAADFFGRGAAIEELVEVLRASGVVTVIGPSGVGKSSVVRAGLVPALRSGAIRGSESWITTAMLPGSHPFIELQRALERVVTDVPIGLADAIASHAPHALHSVRQVLPERSDLLIVIDQFEELFTMTGESERAAFLDLILSSVDDGHARFAITLRADFLDGPLSHARFAELLKRSTAMLRSPSASELEEAITSPAQRVGVRVDPGLAQRIVADLADQPGSLPLLQHTLGALFEIRRSDLIDLATFDEIGGVSGSLARTAEEIFGSLEPVAQESTKQALLRLVSISNESAPTRNRVRVGDLADLDLGEALKPFARQRLLVFDSDPETHEPTAEVAHEALLVHWPRLAGWIDLAREDLILSHRLNEAITDWDAAERSDNYLLAEGRLAQHQAWTANSSLRLTATQREYVAASADRQALVERRKRKARTVTMAVITSIAVAASAFGVMAVRSQRNATKAADLARARELAASAISVADQDPELATLLSIAAIEQAPEGEGVFPEGLVSLREAVNANRLVDRLDLPGAAGVAFTPDAGAVLITEPEIRRVSKYSVDNGRFGEDPDWIYEDLTTIDFMRGTLVHPDGAYAVLMIGDENFEGNPGPEVELIDGEDGFGGRMVLLDMATGERMQTVKLEGCREVVINGGKPWFSTDGSVLGVAAAPTECAPDSDRRGFLLLDTDSWSTIMEAQFGQVEMTADMSRLFIDNFGGPAEFLAYPSLEIESSFEIDSGGGFRGISPDGSIIVVNPQEAGDLRPSFWDAQSGLMLGRAENHEGFATGGDFTPTGLVHFNSAEKSGLWDPHTGRQVLELGSSFTQDGSVSADGRLLATASPGVGVELWDLGLAGAGAASLSAGEAGLIWINPDAINDQGPNVALWGFSGFGGVDTGQIIVVLDATTGSVIAARRAHQDFGQLPDGRVVVLPISDDRTMIGPLVLWDPATGHDTVIQDCTAPLEEYASPLPDGSLGPFKGFICPDGELLFGAATGVSADGTVIAALGLDVTTAGPDPEDGAEAMLLRTWNAETLAVIATVEVAQGLRNETLQAVGNGWALVLDGSGGGPIPSTSTAIDTSTGEILATLQGTWERGIDELSNDGATLYIADRAGMIFEYDTTTWELVRSWSTGIEQVRGLAISPDGRFVAASGEDDRVAIWMVDSPVAALVMQIPTGTWASDIVWIDEDTLGAALIAGFGNAAWQTFDLDSGAVVQTAREGLARDFTDDECQTYGLDLCGSR